MIGVIILHYNNSAIGGGFKYVNNATIQEKYLYLSESLFICAVNLFVMISAYFLSVTQKRKFVKVVELIGQVITFKVAYYLATIFFGVQEISFLGIVRAVLPVNYFVIFYSIVYIVSPYINLMIKNISQRDFKKLVIILFFFFSVWATAADLLAGYLGEEIQGLNTVGLYGDQQGYTIVNFILVYFIGAYIRLNNISVTKNKSAIGIVICVVLIYLCSLHSGIAWIYNNPVVILLPIFLILFFTKLQLQSKIINELAKAAFTCYLFHMYFMSKLGVEKVVNQNIFVLILHQFGSAIALYLASYIVYKIYHKFTNSIIKHIAPRCEKIDISL